MRRDGVEGAVTGANRPKRRRASRQKEKQETEAQKAERLVAEELRKHGWTEADLKLLRKTDATKVKMALRLRRETVQTLDWIAQRLTMGCRHTLANCLKRAKIDNSRD